MKIKMALPGIPLVCLALSISVFSSVVLAEEVKNIKAVTTSKAASISAGDAKSNPMVLILDASGSMWGQIDGKAKISIAKDVLKELIDGLPADLQVGLSVYGHRRERDCKDTEMLMPIGQLNAAAIKAKIDAISPKGKTPLSDAVKQAAEALRYTQQRATVVLVTDGLETCNADPCTLAAELARAGMDFKVHVIGFDISKEDQGRLRCLADKTGGLFLAAADAKSLRAALSQTMTKAQEPPPPVVEDPGTASVRGPATVPAGSAFDVAWEGPNSHKDYISIAAKGAKELEYKDYAYTERGNPARVVAPGDPGQYELRYVHDHTHKVIGWADIQVTPVQASVQPPATVPAASEFQVPWQGPSYDIDYITIADPSSPADSYDNYAYTRDGNPAKLTAPAEPGNYEVRYIQGNGTRLLAKAQMSVQAVAAEVGPQASVQAGAAFQVAWQGPGYDGDYLTVARPGDPADGYDNYAYTRDGNPAKLIAPSSPGNYEVRYIMAKETKQLAMAPVSVTAVSAQVNAPVSVDAGADFEVQWEGPNYQGDYVTIVKADADAGEYGSYAYTRDGSPSRLKAPEEPGPYEVRYIMDRDRVILSRTPVTVK